MKTLLIIYHSQSGNTAALANAVIGGAKKEPIELRVKTAFEADLQDLLAADGLLIGSPENLGYMAGAIKDFIDRTFYPAQPYALNIPYGLFISAGNDGSGAVRELDRALLGYPMKKAVEPVIVRGLIRDADLELCATLGEAMAAGLIMGAL